MPIGPTIKRLSRSPWVRRGIAVTAAVALTLVFGGNLLLRSEAFWRWAVIDRTLGPFWQTSLRWGSFKVHLLRPGVTLRDVVLIDPLTQEPALEASEFDLRFRPTLNWDNLTVRRFRLRDVTLTLDYNSEGITGLDRALARLTEGRRPWEDTRAFSDGPIVPRLQVEDVVLERFRLVYREGRFEGLDLTTTYSTGRDPLRFTLAEEGPDRRTGSIDQFARLFAEGPVRGQLNGYSFDARGDVVLTLRGLRQFPQSTLDATITVTPLSGDPRFVVDFTLGLERIPFRPIASKYQQFAIMLTESTESEALLSMGPGSFDPLMGELDASLTIGATMRQFKDVLGAYLVPRDAERFRKLVRGLQVAGLPADGETLGRIDGAIHLRTRGVAQYGIVSERERLPAMVQSEGRLTVSDLRLMELDRDGFLQSFLAIRPDSSPRKTFDARWNFFLDDETDDGALQFQASVVPIDDEEEDFRFRVSLSDPMNPNQPVRFRPSGMGQMPGLADLVIAAQQEPGEQLAFLPNYESLFRSSAEPIRLLLRGLDSLALQDARVTADLTLLTEDAVRAVFEPILGVIDESGPAQLSTMIHRFAPGGISEWRAALDVPDLRLRDVDGALSLSGSSTLLRRQDLITVDELEVSLVRRDGTPEDPGAILALGLLGDGDESEITGPRSPSVINLATGEATLRLRADSLTRDIMEVLLRIQTFGLSDQLAEPFYQRLLDVLGFLPGSERARGEALGSITISMGDQIDVGTVVSILNIPAANFIPFSVDGEPTDEFLNVTLQQASRLDRRTELLTPRVFVLTGRLGDRADTALELRLIRDQDTVLDFPELQRFAEADLLPAEDAGPLPTGPLQRLSLLAIGFFERLEALKETVRGGGGRLVLTLPAVELADLKRTLQAAGFPVETGQLDLTLVAGLDRRLQEGDALVSGSFSLRNLELEGVSGVLPPAEGALELRQDRERLLLQDARTSLFFPGAPHPTEFLFNGEVDTQSFDAEWSLLLRGVVGGALGMLAFVDDEAVASVARIFQSLPTDALWRLASDADGIVIRLDGETRGLDGSARLFASQRGAGIQFLPTVFAPLRFEIEQEIRYTDAEGIALHALKGELAEEGASEAIATLQMGEPLRLTGKVGNESVIQLRASKDLAPIADRLAALPLPIVERALTGGRFAGALDIIFPNGVIGSDLSMLNVQNRFDVSATDVTLAGFGEAIGVAMTGVLRSEEATFQSENTEMRLTLSDKLVGMIRLDGRYTPPDDALSLIVALEGLRPAILRAFPSAFRRLTETPTTRLDLTLRFDGQPVRGVGALDLNLLGTTLALPSVLLPDGGVFEPPPLQLALSMAGQLNREAREVSLSDFFASLGPESTAPTGAPPLLHATQSGVIVWGLGSRLPRPRNGDASQLRLMVGPVDLADYAPVLFQVIGSPVGQGRLEGRVDLGFEGEGEESVAFAELEVLLRDAQWSPDNTPGTPFVFEATGRLVQSGATILLPELRLLALHPLDPLDRQRDEIIVSAAYTDPETGPQRLRIDVRSPMLSADRLARLVVGYQEKRNRFQRAEPLESTAAVREAEDVKRDLLDGLDLLDDLSIEVSADMRQLRFGELLIARSLLEASFEDNIAQIERFESQIGDGNLAVTGSLRREEASLPWQLSAEAARLPLEAFFLAAARNSGEPPAIPFDGTLSGRLTASASGLTREELSEAVGRLSLQLRDGALTDPFLRRVLGRGSSVDGNLTMLVDANRAVFELTTPWNRSRHALFRGIIRDLVPEEGERPFLRATADYRRVTTVGPAGRSVRQEGAWRPPQQTLFGFMVDFSGPIGGERGETRLRTFHY